MTAMRMRYTGRYLPEQRLSLTDLSELGYETGEGDDFFDAAEHRHWSNEQETTLHMGTQAAKDLLDTHGVDPASIDLVVFSSLIGDYVAPQSSSGIQHAIGASNATAICLDTGCASFVSGVKYGALLIRSGAFRNVLVVSVSNFAGRAQRKVRNASATVPGDGAGAVLLEAADGDDCSLLGHWEKSHGEHHGIFAVHAVDGDGQPTKVWEPSESAAFCFDPELVETIKANGRTVVPEAMRGCLDDAGLTPDDIDHLFTHQPNQFLIDFWREASGVAAEKHFHTLDDYGNLFQASVPVSLADAVRQGRVKDGELLLMSSFSFAGELASAVVVRFG